MFWGAEESRTAAAVLYSPMVSRRRIDGSAPEAGGLGLLCEVDFTALGKETAGAQRNREISTRSPSSLCLGPSLSGHSQRGGACAEKAPGVQWLLVSLFAPL